ncbi:MAG: ferrous iron transport protein A [Planctomycetes bacterium]|nr:ferrous iron transport protein A [Planctomycetota bacterium]
MPSSQSEIPVPTAAPTPVTLIEALAGGATVHEVVAVQGDDPLARRLQTAGVWPGARLELLARAPFGDPLLFRVHGFRLALRRSEAQRVLVVAGGAGS